MNSRQITLYHAARSRSSGAVALLEALEKPPAGLPPIDLMHYGEFTS